MLRSLAERWGLNKPQTPWAGQIVEVRDGVVTGWVACAHAPSETHISLSVNGYRSEQIHVTFSEIVGQKDRFQFEIHLSNTTAVGDVIRVHVGKAKAEIAGSPWIVRETPKTDFEYAFLHVPKTAGTSLRLSLERALEQGAVFPSQGYLTGRGGGYPSYAEYKELAYGLGAKVRVLQGHLMLPQIRQLAPNARVIAIFREPVERVLSLIKHRLASEGLEDSSEKDIAERFLTRGGSGVANGQLRALIGQSALEASQECPVTLATEKLASIEFLGTSENYARLLEQISKSIGASLQNQRLNTTRMPDRQFSESFIDRVRELNQLDVSFYDEVVAQVADRAKS